jgi:CRISPR-associated exonuclease Cas4
VFKIQGETETTTLTGTHINYYFTCPRKLWFFHRSIQCEQESDLVKIGKIYHEDLDEITIDSIKIDMMKKGKIWELKKSVKNRKASIYQALYYLYVLRQKGIETSAIIKYKENNRTEEVLLTKEKEEEMLEILDDIIKIVKGAIPKRINKKICKKCSYYELCYV